MKRALLPLLAALALPACASEGARPSILLVVLDTVRADAVSAYGSAAGTTPAIDRLAAEGLLYERAWAQAPWTLPSHVTLLSGLPPERHAVSARNLVAGDDLLLLAERLSAAGYETAAVSENPWVTRATNLAQGFEHFASAGVVGRGAEARIPADRAPLLLERWLASRSGDGPAFVFLNLVDAHFPYRVRDRNPHLPAGASVARARELAAGLEPRVCAEWPAHAPEMEILRGLYLGGVAAADAKLARMRAMLLERGPSGPWITIVTSDHGEHFGEHGLRDHHYSLHEELLRVPLVVHGVPGAAPARLREPVASMDLVPTILALAGVPAPEALPGRPLPLAPGAGDPGGAERLITATFRDALEAPPAGPLGRTAARWVADLRHGCPPGAVPAGDQRAGIRFPYKLIARGGSPPRLHRLDEDPREQRDLAPAHARLVQEIASGLPGPPDASPEAAGPEAELPGETRDALRALGYLQDGD